ncbi:hypothetical protein [Sphingomonas carotinifaciens]|uniref:hypothetical protein n=1 Tax=Sphingomonas carotinifaciens TaxID=1166323 RepID=UPI000DD664E4|nr:hypothetical protein [Sphingomonas carotinifaciens]
MEITMAWSEAIPAAGAGIQQLEVLRDRVTAAQFDRVFQSLDPARQVDLLFAIASGEASA